MMLRFFASRPTLLPMTSGKCATVLAMIGLFAGMGFAQTTPNDEELGQFLKTYENAFNERDVEAAGKLWAENAEYVDEAAGLRLSGRQEILDAYAELFKQSDAGQVAIEIVSIRQITDSVITLEAISTLTHGEEAVPSRFLATLVKVGDQWLVDNAREMPMNSVDEQHDQLRQLNWLVGEWQEETESHKVMTSFHWSSSRSFLIRSYTAWQDGEMDVEGTQIIGWDPREERIRSWSFDSNGSFGEESWVQQDGTWICKLTRTLADGGLATGTQTLKEVEPGVMEVQLADVVVDGTKETDPGPARMYRVVASETGQPAEEQAPNDQ